MYALLYWYIVCPFAKVGFKVSTWIFIQVSRHVINHILFYALRLFNEFRVALWINNNIKEMKKIVNAISKKNDLDLFQISTGGDRTLYAAGVALGNPATNNVRFGTTYGASSELTGTLIVPSPSNVLQGVGTDATVGTLLMTPADFWNYLISSGFTANSIGDRLQNAATVATTGGQIASYNI